MRTTCKGKTCGRAIIMAATDEGRFIPLDDRFPIYELTELGPDKHHAKKMPLGRFGVLHHKTCPDVRDFSKAAAPLSSADAAAPANPTRNFEAIAQEPSILPIGTHLWSRVTVEGGRVIRETANGADGPWKPCDPLNVIEVSVRRIIAVRLLFACHELAVDPEFEVQFRLAFWSQFPMAVELAGRTMVARRMERVFDRLKTDPGERERFRSAFWMEFPDPESAEVDVVKPIADVCGGMQPTTERRPHLLAALEGLQWVTHNGACPKGDPYASFRQQPLQCTCGVDAARAALQAARRP